MYGIVQKILSFAIVLLMAPLAHADAPKVGRTAAAKYFQNATVPDENKVREIASEIGAGDHYMTIGASTFTKSDSYNWGTGSKETGIAKWGLDMSYRLSQYNSLLDYAIRVSYTEYEPAKQKANKLILMYAATLPDAGSKFPLYFGAAAGGGVYFTQLSGESPVSFDYQVYLGLRLFDVFEKTGFYLEGGLKNHIHLTSDGQLNGTYVSGGAVFTF